MDSWMKWPLGVSCIPQDGSKPDLHHIFMLIAFPPPFCVFRTSSLLPTLTMFCHVPTLDQTCLTKWSMPSSAGGGRSRNRGSLCLTAMWFSVKLVLGGGPNNNNNSSTIIGRKRQNKHKKHTLWPETISLYCFLPLICDLFLIKRDPAWG